MYLNIVFKDTTECTIDTKDFGDSRLGFALDRMAAIHGEPQFEIINEPWHKIFNPYGTQKGMP